MKKIFLLLSLFIVLASFWPIVSVQAETGLAQLAQCTGTDCSTCNIVSMANGLIKWLIGFCFLLFTILLVVAGVRMVTSGGNSHAVEESKGSFVNALIGFVIILSAWLIVDTVMRALVGTDGHEGQLVTEGSASGYLFWSEVSCQKQKTPENTGQETVDYAPEYVEDDSIVAPYSDGYGPGGGSSVTPSGGSGANCPVPPESGMVTIPGTNYKARSSVAQNFVAMRQAAARDGITLTVTSGYRSEAKQLSIWYSHGCDKHSCSGTVGRPCTLGGNGSNHNSGNAVDISVGSSGSKTFNWLKAHGGAYGFNNKLDARDPFHWSLSGR